VYDVHEKNLGYDVTSLDLGSGELRLIEVKGLGAATGTILLTPTSGAWPRTAATATGCMLSPTAGSCPCCRADQGSSPLPMA